MTSVCFLSTQNQVCVKPLSSSTLNITLPTIAAAERRRLQHGARSYRSYLRQTPAMSSKPADRRCCSRSTGRTDVRPLHRPCSAYYAGSVSDCDIHCFSGCCCLVDRVAWQCPLAGLCLCVSACVGHTVCKRAGSCGPKQPSVRCGYTLAPPEEYDLTEKSDPCAHCAAVRPYVKLF